MDRREHVRPRRQGKAKPPADLLQDGRIAHLGRDPGGEVLHQVADERHAVPDPLGDEVRNGSGRRREQPARDVVGQDPVRLLGHPAVKAPQPGFDVSNGDPGSHRCQRSSQRGVGVAIDEDSIGTSALEDRRDRGKHPTELLGSTSAANAERVVRFRQAQLREERPGHRVIPVLAGVHEDFVVPGTQGRQERRRFDELGSRPDDADDSHDSSLVPVNGRGDEWDDPLWRRLARVQPGTTTAGTRERPGMPIPR